MFGGKDSYILLSLQLGGNSAFRSERLLCSTAPGQGVGGLLMLYLLGLTFGLAWFNSLTIFVLASPVNATPNES